MSFEKVPNFLGDFFRTKMKDGDARIFRFNSFLLDAEERELRRGGDVIPLTPKAFDTLVYLLRNGGHLVSKEELLAAVWPGTFVFEGNLPRTIHTIRRALGEDDNKNKFIETVPTKGYRFVAEFTAAATLDETAEGGLSNGKSEAIRERGTPRRWGLTRVASVAVIVLVCALIFGFVRFRSRMLGEVVGERPPAKTKSGEAYRLFEHGRYLLDRHLDENDDQAAFADFANATELDPEFAGAYAGKADAKSRMFWTSGSHEDISAARVAVQKALELDESNAYAHIIKCRITGTYDWNFSEAESECRRALELDPGSGEAHREYALILSALGRDGEAIAEIDKSIEFAPTSFNKRSRGVILYFTRRYDEAIDQLKQVDETDPEFSLCAPFLLRAYEMKGNWEKALEYYIRTQKAATAAQAEVIRYRFADQGWRGVLRYMTENPDKNNFLLAGTLAQLGEKDKAFQLLNELADRRRVMVIHTAREPRLDPVRDDPRYLDLLKRIGLRN